ncbi:hypothetical protein D3C78_1696240 [compost metagenome]
MLLGQPGETPLQTAYMGVPAHLEGVSVEVAAAVLHRVANQQASVIGQAQCSAGRAGRQHAPGRRAAHLLVFDIGQRTR